MIRLFCTRSLLDYRARRAGQHPNRAKGNAKASWKAGKRRVSWELCTLLNPILAECYKHWVPFYPTPQSAFGAHELLTGGWGHSDKVSLVLEVQEVAHVSDKEGKKPGLGTRYLTRLSLRLLIFFGGLLLEPCLQSKMTALLLKVYSQVYSGPKLATYLHIISILGCLAVCKGQLFLLCSVE
jgi:hypothetical protein